MIDPGCNNLSPTLVPKANGLPDDIVQNFFAQMPSGAVFCKMLYRNGQPEDFVCLYSNQAFHAQTGLGPVDGLRISVAVPGILEANPEFLSVFGRVAGGGSAESFETFVDGLQQWFSVQACSSKPGHFIAAFNAINQRKVAEESLVASEKLYRGLLEDQTETICRFKADGSLLYVNDAFCKLLGKSREALLGLSWHPSVWDEDLPLVNAKLATLSPGNPVVTIENRIIAVHGEIRWGQFVNRAFFDGQGDLLEIQAVGRDITEQKLSEAANAELYTRLAKISSRVPGVIYQYKLRSDGSSCFPYASEAIRDIYRVTPEAVQDDASAVFAILHPDDYAGVADSIRQSAATLEPWQQEYRVRFTDGCVRWLYGNAVPRNASDGSVIWDGFITDITERKLLEDRLRVSAQELQDLYDRAPCGYHSIDVNGVFTNINDTELAWLGCGRNELVGKKRISEFMTAESKERFKVTFPQFIAAGHIENVEFELVGKNGAIRQVSANATAINDSVGNFVKSRSVLHDISELKKIHNELMLLTAEQQAMLDNELVGIVKVRNRHTIWINSAMERIFGYGEGELDGQPNRMLYLNERSYQEVGAAAYPILKAHGVYRTQLKMRRKDGEVIWIDLNGMQLPGDSRDSVWMLLDITASKRYEEEIERIAFHDVLTGLPNRKLITDRLKQALALAKRNQHPLAVCYLDLDGFKPVNDQYGHAAGDKLLIEIARRIQEAVRVNDTVGRLGGDEFVLLLTGLKQIDEYRPVLQRVIDAINAPFSIGQRLVSVGASIGVALFARDGDNPDMLLRHSDQAMYQAKKSGRNRVCLYEAESNG